MMNFVISACHVTCPANSTCSCQYPDCRPSCFKSQYPYDPGTYYCVNKCWCNIGFVQNSNGDCVSTCPPYLGDGYSK